MTLPVNIHSIAELIKLFLQELPQGPLLMTKGLHQASGKMYYFCNNTSQKKLIKRNELQVLYLIFRVNLSSVIREELLSIPDTNYFTLWRVFGVLNTIVMNVEQTKMTPSNLASLFSVSFHFIPILTIKPSLRICAELITTFIEDYAVNYFLFYYNTCRKYLLNDKKNFL